MNAPMIFAEPKTANAIALKMEQTRGKSYAVIKVTTGWQVAPVKVCKPYMPPAKPLPVKTLTQQIADTLAKPLPENLFEIVLPYRGQSAKYVEVVLNSKVAWFGKSTLVAWEIADNHVQLRMDVKQAKKRGLV
jgi:hypothetical protein